MKAKQDAVARFNAKIWPLPTTGCWLWDGKVHHPTGYGHFWFNEKMIGAHVASWLIHHGEKPPGMHVLHSCDLRCCVNPGHLFLGTHKVNMADMATKKRSAGLRRKGVCHPLARATEADVIEIREEARQGMRTMDIAKKHKLSRQAVGDIVSRRNWRHL